MSVRSRRGGGAYDVGPTAAGHTGLTVMDKYDAMARVSEAQKLGRVITHAPAETVPEGHVISHFGETPRFSAVGANGQDYRTPVTSFPADRIEEARAKGYAR